MDTNDAKHLIMVAVDAIECVQKDVEYLQKDVELLHKDVKDLINGIGLLISMMDAERIRELKKGEKCDN